MLDKNRVILHCDANNFYASVECVLNPKIKNCYVAVCGDPDKRHGIVLAKNQKAKVKGVKTGDTIWQAKQKCPNLIIVKPHYDEYVNYSNCLFNIYSQFTDRIESFGLDECWLDVTHSKIFGDGEKIANTIREKVKKELGITLSIGVSFNKIFAKLGSDYKKPDATTIISKDNFKNIVFPLDVSNLLMVGQQTNKNLKKINIYTIGQLANTSPNLLKSFFGINGLKLHEWANGNDDSPVKYYYEHDTPKTIGNSITTYIDLKSIEEQKCVIRSLCELVATRLQKINMATTNISIGLKYSNFTSFNAQSSIDLTNNSLLLYKTACKILQKCPKNYNVRAISVYACNIHDFKNIQLNMFNINYDKYISLDSSINKIKDKYGYKSIIPASTLIHPELCADIQYSNFKPFKH